VTRVMTAELRRRSRPHHHGGPRHGPLAPHVARQRAADVPTPALPWRLHRFATVADQVGFVSQCATCWGWYDDPRHLVPLRRRRWFTRRVQSGDPS
jgi:hypothetical protein